MVLDAVDGEKEKTEEKWKCVQSIFSERMNIGASWIRTDCNTQIPLFHLFFFLVRFFFFVFSYFVNSFS